MKKYFLCLFLLLIFLVLPVQAAQLEMRGVWVSSVYNLDYPSRPGLSEAQLKKEADTIVEQAADWGMTTIFLQVRPAGDALYPSKLAPWSSVLSGKQGQAPDQGFDPLAYFVQQCHAKGLELHAWLNPYRITRTAVKTREDAFAQLCADHPAHQLTDCVVFHSDGCLYYDPGQPQVQQHLLDIAREILETYDVDGIHLDDYFYPGSSFADQDTYEKYGSDFPNIGDFRREAVCRLVNGLHDLTKNAKPDAQFGVSPAGIWASSLQIPTGADTMGNQSYFESYADSRRWVREGMVDYIAPQIYWEMGAMSGDFSVLLDWWNKTVADTKVKLYIGLAAYKSVDAQQDSVWHGTEELQRQLAAIEESTHTSGALFFRYGSLLKLDTDFLHREPVETVQTPRESLWPEALTLNRPQGNQAVLSGDQLSVSCTAPRYSKVTVFYGSNYATLRSDCNGGYRGYLTAETPFADQSYTAPALVCSEKFGILTVQLTAFTVTSVQAPNVVSIEKIQWSQADDLHQIDFYTQTPCAAKFDLTGDVLTLDFSPCRLGVLFNDDTFERMTVEQSEETTRYRLVFPDDMQQRQVQLLWAPDKITLLIRKNPQEHPEVDPQDAESSSHSTVPPPVHDRP